MQGETSNHPLSTATVCQARWILSLSSGGFAPEAIGRLGLLPKWYWRPVLSAVCHMMCAVRVLANLVLCDLAVGLPDTLNAPQIPHVIMSRAETSHARGVLATTSACARSGTAGRRRIGLRACVRCIRCHTGQTAAPRSRVSTTLTLAVALVPLLSFPRL